LFVFTVFIAGSVLWLVVYVRLKIRVSLVQWFGASMRLTLKGKVR